ncbi:hypothetical protein QBC44DRAFT_228558 [Cladorrhinum sp. PSN332]|nr:hypothetical protein QBC44DRAFT_228558 [Cladorrhinum sp. PSN332]
MEKRASEIHRPPRVDILPRRRDATCISLASIVVGVLFLGSLPNIGFWDFGLWGNGDPSSSSPPHSGLKPDPNNPWESITPSSKLEWHPCYQFMPPGTFLCARLSLPMIYQNNNASSSSSSHKKTSTAKVDVALLLLPASANSTAPKSPLLVNPGGPGGSGVQLVLLLGKSIQAVFGPDQPVLGFDPRGVGYTTPLADCWARRPCDNCPEDAAGGFMHRLDWENSMWGYGFINDSDVSLRYLNAGQRAVNGLCGEKAEQQEGDMGNEGVLKYAGTKYVARDMLEIVEAWDRWTEKGKGLEVDMQQQQMGKLTYWGFSYGTYLGMTFARMFPDRVGRMILDGVVDSDYYEQEFWAESLLDADKIWGRFFEYCVEAESKCAFWKEGDGVEDLRERYEGAMEALDSEEEGPVTFTHPTYFYPVVLRKSYFRLIVFGTLKAPVLAYPALAGLLKILAERRYEFLSAMFADRQLLCSLPGNLPFINLVSDAQRAIMCADKDEKHRVNLTVPEIRDAFGQMAKVSDYADIWVGLMLQCNGWDISKPYRLESELENQWVEASNHRGQINTSFPILFLGNTYDPVTPLLAAVKMSLRFKDAGVIELKTEGHCTVGSAVSLCIAKAVRDYILHGKVPPPAEVEGNKYLDGKWTQCEADERPWKRVDKASAAYKQEGDAELMAAFKEVQEVMVTVGRFESESNGLKGSRISRQELVSKFGGIH